MATYQRGRKPDYKADAQVVKLRVEGKSFREIAQAIGRTVSVAHRRYARGVRSLSTVRR